MQNTDDRPRESDPTARPSDDVTGKVVARQLGLKGADANLTVGWCNKAGDSWLEDPEGREYADPRDDTDAALELLRHIECTASNLRIDEVHEDSTFYKWDEGSISIPVSGEPFRYAVVHLAARVWGIQEYEKN